jgi:Fe-S-cluster formation regulator IscX/YfhJ
MLEICVILPCDVCSEHLSILNADVDPNKIQFRQVHQLHFKLYMLFNIDKGQDAFFLYY